MRHLVAGLGEIGSALREVLDCSGHDPAKGILSSLERCEFLHICFPYSEVFAESVRQYQDRFRPAFTVIHATVPVGTSEALGAAHSPVRGKHPNLKQSLLTFVKYVGGYGASEIAEELATFGIDCRIIEKAADCEALKLWDTTYYYWNIMFMRLVHRYCEERGLLFDVVYTSANKTYNRGYMEMGRPEFVRPVLEYAPGPTGGHCLVPNVELLGGEIADILRQHEQLQSRNETYQ